MSSEECGAKDHSGAEDRVARRLKVLSNAAENERMLLGAAGLRCARLNSDYPQYRAQVEKNLLEAVARMQVTMEDPDVDVQGFVLLSVGVGKGTKEGKVHLDQFLIGQPALLMHMVTTMFAASEQSMLEGKWCTCGSCRMQDSMELLAAVAGGILGPGSFEA